MKKVLVLLLSVLLVVSISLSIGCKKAEQPMEAPKPAEEAPAPAPEAPAPAPEAPAPAPEKPAH